MHNKNEMGEETLVLTEAELILLMELGFFADLKRKKIRFNPRPFSNPVHLQIKKPEIQKTNIVDLHLDIVKKVDALIAKHEHERRLPQSTLFTQVRPETPLTEFIEIREPNIKTPDMPSFTPIIDINNNFGEEAFEIEQPQNMDFVSVNHQIFNKNEQEQIDEGPVSQMFGSEDQDSIKTSMGLGKIKVNSKPNTSTKKQTNNNNTLSTAQEELEQTKQEIEETKRQLEIAKMKEKEKEKELRQKSIEKKKAEKLRIIEEKKRLKEKKLQEKQSLKAAKLKEREQLKLEKQRELELKKKEKEKIKLEKQKILEQKKLEKEQLKLQKQKELKKKKPEKNKEKFNFFKKEKAQKTTTETKEVKDEPTQDTYEIDKMIIDKQKTPEPSSIINQEKPKEPATKFDQDVERLLPILDSLLEKLPEEVISEFAESDDFDLYEKVMKKYKK